MASPVVHDLVVRSDELRSCRQSFFLSSTQWRAYASLVTLNWNHVQFLEANATSVPDDVGGLYSFVVSPGIANHLGIGYLMYVGMTTRTFRERYAEYIRDTKKIKRPHISRMLVKWPDNVFFYYTPLPAGAVIKDEEDHLIAALLPPYNEKVPAHVKEIVKAALK